ncbi:MAG: type II secretion system protein M [Pseudomonadota bacterium]
MKKWFMQLRPNDRRALLIGAAVLLLASIYFLVWQPVTSHAQQLRQSVKENQALLAWMQQAAQQAAQLRAAHPGAAQVSDGQSLLAVVDQSAKSGRLGGAVKRVEPEGRNTVRVWLEQASFDDTVLWLDNLQRNNGVRVQNIVVERQAAPGLINARVSLQGAGA